MKIAYYLAPVNNYLVDIFPQIKGGRPRVRDTTLTKERWNVCIQHLTSILCNYQSNLD